MIFSLYMHKVDVRIFAVSQPLLLHMCCADFLLCADHSLIKTYFLTAKVAVQQSIRSICVSVCLFVPLLKFFF